MFRFVCRSAAAGLWTQDTPPFNTFLLVKPAVVMLDPTPHQERRNLHTQEHHCDGARFPTRAKIRVWIYHRAIRMPIAGRLIKNNLSVTRPDNTFWRYWMNLTKATRRMRLKLVVVSWMTSLAWRLLYRSAHCTWRLCRQTTEPSCARCVVKS